ncbi:CD3072 family TudS-related putative desulfidase [Halocella sp. SP3-1]|uniref:CD3072 family TudS-related putative desulfidase n=1 Tax=Halocella sp. SP3-1 TaxID=2382161 RepID=UPI000F764AEE|nr:CD3072 family TudS-related putative desulfidase [Halocella sp. SP3-1]AZO94725.1 DUF523 domain-containing protein [Halocella sp. SP3-1]
MKRNKKIVLVAHCILNCNSKVEGLSQYRGALSEIVNLLVERGIGIIQLPCPELTMYGIKRWGHVREQFDTPYFRKHCRQIFEPYLQQIKGYLASNYQILGLIGIDGSPSCGVNKTCSGNWGGELLEASVNKEKITTWEMIQARGVFIEEIILSLKESQIEISLTAIDEDNLKKSKEKIINIL